MTSSDLNTSAIESHIFIILILNLVTDICSITVTHHLIYLNAVHSRLDAYTVLALCAVDVALFLEVYLLTVVIKYLIL